MAQLDISKEFKKEHFKDLKIEPKKEQKISKEKSRSIKRKKSNTKSITFLPIFKNPIIKII